MSSRSFGANKTDGIGAPTARLLHAPGRLARVSIARDDLLRLRDSVTPGDDVDVDSRGGSQVGDLPDDGTTAFELLPTASVARPHHYLGDLLGTGEVDDRLRGVVGLDLGP